MNRRIIINRYQYVNRNQKNNLKNGKSKSRNGIGKQSEKYDREREERIVAFVREKPEIRSREK